MKHSPNLPKRWRKQLRLYRTFFLSTLWVSIPIALAATFLAYMYRPTDILRSFFFYLSTVGLGFDILNKEMTGKEEYFFFYNMGISKVKLWVVTFIITAMLSFILYNTIQLCVYVWK